MHRLLCMFSDHTLFVSLFIPYASMSNDIKLHMYIWFPLLFHLVGGISYSSVDVTGHIVDNNCNTKQRY